MSLEEYEELFFNHEVADYQGYKLTSIDIEVGTIEVRRQEEDGFSSYILLIGQSYVQISGAGKSDVTLLTEAENNKLTSIVATISY